jgi:hypothetical protein
LTSRFRAVSITVIPMSGAAKNITNIGGFRQYR